MAKIIIGNLPDDQMFNNDEERKKALGEFDDLNKFTEDLTQPRSDYNMGCGSYSSACGCGCS